MSRGNKALVRVFLGPAFEVERVVVDAEVQCLGCGKKWIAMVDCTPCGCDAKLRTIAQHVRFVAEIRPRRRRPRITYAHGCSKSHDPGLRCVHGACCFDCIASSCLPYK